MRILFLTFYYEPDLCAGSFRNSALVNELLKQLPEGGHIDVLTTLPNRYASFNIETLEKEVINNLTIERIALPDHQSGMIDQSKTFFTFASEVFKRTFDRDYDLVYASSSRLMTAALGASIARHKNIPLYLDIRDIFVDTIKDVLPQKLAWVMKPTLSAVERLTVRQAQKVNLVSGGFKQYFESRYPNQSFTYFTNGIDGEFIDAQPQKKSVSESAIPEVIYAGNFGEGQGLHSIIPQLAKHFDGRLKFRLFGDGGRRSQLETELEKQQITNVELQTPVSRKDLIKIYQQADVLFLHLNDYDAFLKVLPSKIFEYATLGKPIWAGVSGFSAQFLNDNVSNVAVFDPCNLEAAIKSFEQLELITQPRSTFVKQFSRDVIMRSMAADILATDKTRKC